jgi:hypothetical protein
LSETYRYQFVYFQNNFDQIIKMIRHGKQWSKNR